jgi:hypothetical protein
MLIALFVVFTMWFAIIYLAAPFILRAMFS